MGKKHKPRSGSLAFYPRKRAKQQLATFTTFAKADEKAAKPLNFVGYKAGMVQVFGRDEHQKSVTFGTEVVVPATVIECPPLKVFGVRLYGKDAGKVQTLGEATIEKPEKHFRKKVVGFKLHQSKKKEQKKSNGIDWLETVKEKAIDVRLLCHTQPSMTAIGKKRPDLFEVYLSGTIEQRIGFAKEKFGHEISVSEIFKDKDFVDVRAVDKGRGFSGVIKRFGVKHHRPKAKKHKVVGSIGPWNPSTVMWTVARAGQLGYQSRTELNKRVIVLGSDPAKVNVNGGFTGFGFVKSNYILLTGSIPGPAKRAIALRHGVRKANNQYNLSGVTVLGTKASAKKMVASDDETKVTKVVAHKEERKEHKSVEDEIAAAVKGK